MQPETSFPVPRQWSILLRKISLSPREADYVVFKLPDKIAALQYLKRVFCQYSLKDFEKSLSFMMDAFL